jgi:hypothetical protein
MCFPKLIQYWISQYTNFKLWVQHTVQKNSVKFTDFLFNGLQNSTTYSEL